MIQNMHYLESGEFVTTKKALKEKVTEKDRGMLMMAEMQDDYDFEKAFPAVFEWCREAFSRIDQMK